MKLVKMLGCPALVVVALMAFAGTAGADTLTSSAGTTPPFKAISTNSTLHNGVGTISCSSSFEGNFEGHGAGKQIFGNLTSLSFERCTGGSTHNSTVIPGVLSLDVTGTNHGTLRSSGTNFTTTMFGVTCGYQTNNTSIGTVTTGKEHAVLDISASLTRSHGSFFCGSTANWTASFQFNSPTNIHLHDN